MDLVFKQPKLAAEKETLLISLYSLYSLNAFSEPVKASKSWLPIIRKLKLDVCH